MHVGSLGLGNYHLGLGDGAKRTAGGRGGGEMVTTTRIHASYKESLNARATWCSGFLFAFRLLPLKPLVAYIFVSIPCLPHMIIYSSGALYGFFQKKASPNVDPQNPVNLYERDPPKKRL